MDAKTKKCPACGALLNVEAKFCNECGCKQVADEIELDEEEFSDKDRPPISIEEAYNLFACDKHYKEKTGHSPLYFFCPILPLIFFLKKDK